MFVFGASVDLDLVEYIRFLDVDIFILSKCLFSRKRITKQNLIKKYSMKNFEICTYI